MCPLRRECTRLRSVSEDTDSTTFGKLIGMTDWARIKFLAGDRANSLRFFGFSRHDRLDLLVQPGSDANEGAETTPTIRLVHSKRIAV